MSDQQAYTRIPNAILEAMPHMKEAELRVVLAIARKTIGWQKESDMITVTQLADATGMKRQGVQNGIDDGMRNGFIVRQPAKKNTFTYRLTTDEERSALNSFHEVEQKQDVSYNDVECSTSANVPPSGTQSFHNVEQNDPKSFHQVDTQKKESKEKKEMSGGEDAMPLNGTPAVRAFFQQFPDRQLSAKEMQAIATTATDLDAWQSTLELWDLSGYRIRIWDMLDRYKKLVAEKQQTPPPVRVNGYGKAPSTPARPSAQPFGAAADYHRNGKP